MFNIQGGNIQGEVGGLPVQRRTKCQQSLNFGQSARGCEIRPRSRSPRISLNALPENLRRGLQPYQFAAAFEQRDIFRSQHHPAAGGDDGVVARGDSGDNGRFQFPETGLADLIEYFLNGLADSFTDYFVGVNKSQLQPPGEQFTDGGFSTAAITNQDDVHDDSRRAMAASHFCQRSVSRGWYTRIVAVPATNSRPAASEEIWPVAMACASTLPMAVASTGPA